VTAVGRTNENRAELNALGAHPIALDILDSDAARRTTAGRDVGKRDPFCPRFAH